MRFWPNANKLTNKHVTDVRFGESRRYHATVHTCEKHGFGLNNKQSTIKTHFYRFARDKQNTHFEFTYLRIVLDLNKFFDHLLSCGTPVAHYSP